MAIVYFQIKGGWYTTMLAPKEVSYHNIQKKAPSRYLYFCRIHSFNAKTGFTRNQSPLNEKQLILTRYESCIQITETDSPSMHGSELEVN